MVADSVRQWPARIAFIATLDAAAVIVPRVTCISTLVYKLCEFKKGHSPNQAFHASPPEARVERRYATFSTYCRTRNLSDISITY